MNLKSMTLRDFRNYREETFQFDPGVNLIVGDNAQGKTNLLEAVVYAGSGKSFRAQKTAELVRFGADFGELETALYSQERHQSLRWLLFPDGRKRQLFCNGVKKKTTAEISGVLHTVLFCPEDLMVLKTAAQEGISLLSGVASDQECKALVNQFSVGELVRILGLIQNTQAGFTRSTSRRMDTELCIVNMCQPELNLDAEALNSRLTRLEDAIRTGSISAPVVAQPAAQVAEEIAPEPVKVEQKPAPELPDEAPVGFWADIAAQLRKELRPPESAYFGGNAVEGRLQNGKLVLVCSNIFTKDSINKPAVLELVAQKAAAKLGAPVRVSVVEQADLVANNGQMEQLLNFGRTHSDVIKIKEY